jgi:hypothetical protein
MKRRSALPRWFLASVLVSVPAFVLPACGPKEPPRQARGDDTPDPIADTPPSQAGSSSGSSSGSKGSKGNDVLASPPPSGKVAAGKGGDAPQVGSLQPFMEQFKWGMSHADVTKVMTQTGGLLWKDYDEKLAKARVGPEQTALEAEREQAKGAFGRSYIEFKDTPTGYDTTGIRGEFSYKNKEALMWVQRQGKKRYFFFMNDRLWKIYDEVPLEESGIYGKAYLDAVNTLNARLSAQGRVQGADANKGILATTVDWKDGSNHLRAVDRTRDNVVGIAVEESSTYGNLAALRPNKLPDPNEIDPSIVAVTKNANISDPNATGTGPAGSAKKATTPPPKKK